MILLDTNVVSAVELGLHRLITKMIQERKTHGRSVDLRDTLIAGIAMAHEAQLATRNLRNLSDTIISHLSLIG